MLGIQGTCLNKIMIIYKKLRANIKVNGKKLEEILLKSGKDNVWHFTHIFNTELHVLDQWDNSARSRGYKLERQKLKYICYENGANFAPYASIQNSNPNGKRLQYKTRHNEIDRGGTPWHRR